MESDRDEVVDLSGLVADLLCKLVQLQSVGVQLAPLPLQALRLHSRLVVGRLQVTLPGRQTHLFVLDDAHRCLDLHGALHSRPITSLVHTQWRRQDFVTAGGSEVWVYRGSRVRSPPVPVVLSVYQRGSLLDGLAMYLSCDAIKFHDNESTHILHNFWTSTV